ncbi:MAG: squalene/phytoene synthase family protein [Ahrensia sp.]
MSENTPTVDALKEADRSLYSAMLYVPQSARDAVATLHLFERETARVRDLVSEPLPGEIRLQWWHDVIMGERDGEAVAHPLAASLLAAIERYGLSRQSLAALTQARVIDLYDDLFPTLHDFEAYCGETWSTVFQASAQILGDGMPPGGDAAGHAGVAYGVSRLASRVAVHRARGQVFVPDEVLRATGGDRDAWLTGEDATPRVRALSAWIEFAQDHEAKARTAISALDALYRPAYMPLALARPILRRMAKQPETALAAPLPEYPIKSQLALLWMVMRP